MSLKLKQDGTMTIELDLFWLRHHCKCELCYNFDSSHPIKKTHEIPSDVGTKHFQIEHDMLIIDWVDGHKSKYPLEISIKNESADTEDTSQNGTKILMNCRFALESFKDDLDVQHLVLDSLDTCGTAYIDGVAPTMEASEEVVSILFELQSQRQIFCNGIANYSDAATEISNAKYTNVCLSPKSEHTYFNDGQGLLMINCVHHSPDCALSYLIEARKISNNLKQKHPEQYISLTTL